MRTKSIAIASCAAVVVLGYALWRHFHSLVDKGDDQSPYALLRVLPAGTTNILDAADRFVLLSLDGNQERRFPGSKAERTTNEIFHGYEVLGKTEIRDARERLELLGALYKGIADSDGRRANCFNPRHGIRAILGEETVDLLICFECWRIETPGRGGDYVSTTRSPEPTFNWALERARLPISKNPK